MPTDRPSGAHVVVSAGTQARVLVPGDVLTFGRGAQNDLRVGAVAEDLRVPRLAGRLECRPDGVLIHNTSDKRPLLMEMFPGPSFEIPPRMLVGTMPHDLVTIVVRGEGRRTYPVRIDLRPLAVSCGRRDGSAATAAEDPARTVGYWRIPAITERQRTLLCALCLPGSIGGNGPAGVPAYAEMERILAERGVRLTAKTIRNTLDDLRQWLTLEHGVADIYGEDAAVTPGGKQSFLPELARWARLSGNVTDAELEEFDRRAG